jgi:ATP adenylyltransferase
MPRDGSSPPQVSPADLASRIVERFVASGASGARLELENREEILVDGGVSFVVRVLAPRFGLAAQRAKAASHSRSGGGSGGASRSPFLPPYDPGLLVGAITATHVGLINKYNLVDRHFLIVTREYEEQESALTAEDLAAARLCLDALDGLVFYNSAAAAGASQSHKHLQHVPFPLGCDGERFPLDRALAKALAAGRDWAPELGYRHRIAKLGPDSDLDVYRRLIVASGLDRDGGRPAPYNLLVGRDWMLIVPRSSGTTGSIEVNALGFAGLLAVRGDEDLALLRAAGPLEILGRVGVRGAV